MGQLKKILRAAPADGGRTVKIDLELEGGEREIIHCPIERAPMLAEALLAGCALADRLRNAPSHETPSADIQSDRSLPLDLPHFAVEVRTGVDMRGNHVTLRIATADGVELAIALPPDMAIDAMERLAGEVKKLYTQPPILLS